MKGKDVKIKALEKGREEEAKLRADIKDLRRQLEAKKPTPGAPQPANISAEELDKLKKEVGPMS